MPNSANTSNNPLKKTAILLIESNDQLATTLITQLGEAGFTAEQAATPLVALIRLKEAAWDLVITDLFLVEDHGRDILTLIRETAPGTDVIILTGDTNPESAVFALKNGARDYLFSPVNSDKIKLAVSLCMQQRLILEENREFRNMLHLYQTSCTIATSLDSERIKHLMLEAIRHETHLSCGLSLFRQEGEFLLHEYRGISLKQARNVRRSLLASLPEPLPVTHHVTTCLLPDETTGICTATLVAFFCCEGLLQGIIALWPPSSPDMTLHLPDASKNILFLLEQSSQAFANAASYTQARDMLYIDDLSGLYNHRYLEVALSRELKRVERYPSHFTVLFLDIDSFKLVNDRYGHLVGSRILKEVGQVLRKSVREVDTVIRYGGDEYTIILIETAADAAAGIAERIRATVAAARFPVGEGESVSITCSVGYACCPEDATTAQHLLNLADQAMYRGKACGKNSICRLATNETHLPEDACHSLP